MIFGAILAWHAPLVIWGVIEVPFFLGFTYTAIVAAMGYELSNDMARAAQLAHELEISDHRLNLAADSADLGLWEWDLSKDEIWVTPTRRAQLGFLFPERSHSKTSFPDGMQMIAIKSDRHSGMRSKTAKITRQSFGGSWRMAVCAGSQRVDVSPQTNTESRYVFWESASTLLLKNRLSWRQPASAMNWCTSRA